MAGALLRGSLKGAAWSLYQPRLLGATVRGRGTPERRGDSWWRPERASPQGPGRPGPSPTCRGAASCGGYSAEPTGAPRAMHTGERVAVHPKAGLSRTSWHPHQQEVPGGALGTWWPKVPEQQVGLHCPSRVTCCHPQPLSPIWSFCHGPLSYLFTWCIYLMLPIFFLPKMYPIKGNFGFS